MPRPPSGAGVARSIAAVLADTLTKHQAASLPGSYAVRNLANQALLEDLEREVRPRAAAIWGDLVNDPNVPDPIKALMAPVVNPQHQVDFLLILIGAIVGSIGVATQIGSIYWRNQINKFQAEFPTVPPSAPDVALAALRGYYDQTSEVPPPEQAVEQAAMTGVGPAVLRMLIFNTGEPLGLQELLLLYRRGQIDDRTLETGIRQSRVRNEWIPSAKMLRYAPPSPAEVINAYVRGHIDEGTARKRYEEGGEDPTFFDTSYAGAGRPPGPGQLGDAWHRGLIPERGIGPNAVTFEAGVRESDIHNKWFDTLVKLSYYVPPPRTVTAMLREGAIDEATAADWFRRNGLDQDMIAAYIAAATHQQTTSTKELAKGEILTLYRDRAIGRAQAKTMLTDLRYTDQAAEFELDIADLARIRRYVEGAITRIHTLYLARKIDETTAHTALGSLGVEADETRELLQTWGLELAANVRILTPAQIVSAYHYAVLDQAEAQAELEHQGYSARDAWTLLSISAHGPLENAPAGA